MNNILDFSKYKDPNFKLLNEMIHESIKLNKTSLLSFIAASTNSKDLQMALEVYSQRIIATYLRTDEDKSYEGLVNLFDNGGIYYLTQYIKERIVETPLIKQEILNKFNEMEIE